MNMTKRDVGSKSSRPLVCMRRPGLAGMGLVGLGLALSAAGCRDQPAPSAAPPPTPADAAALPPDGYVPPPPPPDAPPPLGLGPYANLHADFVARCPITLPENTEPGSLQFQERIGFGPTGRGCNVRKRGYFAFFSVGYTAGDDAHYAMDKLGKEEGYRRVVGNVDEIHLAYQKPPPLNLAICQSIPEELAQIYQHTAGISDEATARLAATLRQVDKIEPPEAYARIRIEDRVLYASIDLGPRDPKDTSCDGIIEAGLTLGYDPVVVDVPLAPATAPTTGR